MSITAKTALERMFLLGLLGYENAVKEEYTGTRPASPSTKRM